MRLKLIQTVNGQTLCHQFADAIDAIPAMEVRGYTFIGLNANPRQRPELQGAPRFKGVNGPMWDGDNTLRYECPETTRTVTQ